MNKKELVADMGIALLWAVLILLVILFSGDETQFIYRNF